MGDKRVLELSEEFSVLIVDDSDFMVQNLERMMGSFGCEVVGTAKDGIEAVEQVENHAEDLDFVTLDITMPEMDGIEALEKIKEIAPNMTVIMVSAMGQEGTVKECIAKGADHFIVKPFEREEVFEKLNKILGD